ncbi:cytochrome P450 [Micromonospora chersina]|uniref:Cytochrome P450 n=1 Tax=Micromonospora chersina TaxID=47854 RepID=A0A1C6TZ14_9ACTN|nr:cytochrome P450 [Micromonospora chersina]SCL47072.1 Cytochrome P450 [Micromonospora chersina]
MSWPTIPPDPDTPPCGPPVPVDGGWVVTRHADVVAVLTDPRYVVPVAPGGPPGTLAWLRGTVSRFSAPDRHPGRRALGVAALRDLDPDELVAAAARLTTQTLDRLAAERTSDRGEAAGRVEVMGPLARRVPLEVLAARLGLADPAAAVPAVTAVAAAYHPGADPAAVALADRAVAVLLAMSPPAPAEAAANRVGLLVQAADATAGLIGAAVRHGLAAPAALGTADLLAEVLRLDPPVRATRRVATGATRLAGRDIGPDAALLLRFDAANRDPAVHEDPDRFHPPAGEQADRAGRPAGAGPKGHLAVARRPGRALTFGAGPRGCPGERHALALAAGVVEVLRARCRPAGTPVRYAPHPTLRVPTSIEVMFR